MSIFDTLCGGGGIVKEIKTVEQWIKYYCKLKEKGYYLWQMQYSIYDTEGFHVWFAASGKPDYEIVTYNAEVYNEIIRYRRDKNV